MEQPLQAEPFTLDPRATLTSWMELYGNSVWTFIYVSVQVKELADDLSQEVFIRAFTHVGGFRGESSVKTWLFAIARNVIKDHNRNAYTRKVRPNQEMAHYIDHGVQAEQGSEDLWDVVVQLKPSYRELVILRLREDLSFAQIADITNTSEASARVRYQRAIKQLRKIMGIEGGTNGD